MGESRAGDFETWRHNIARVASGQWGHVRRQQLLAMGIPPTTVAAWVRDGRLILAYAGVYAVAYRRIDPLARAAAAVLTGYPDAVLSHESAAALWDLRRWPDGAEISSVRRIRRPGITAHRTRGLPEWEITTHWAIPTVTPFRAITGIWGNLTPKQRIRVPADARLRKLISAEEAGYLLGHRRNPTRSWSEDLFQQIVERFGLAQPQTNVFVCGRETDAWFPDQMVVVEIDDPATHWYTDADNRRLDTLRARYGILTVRLLTDDLRDDPAGVAASLKEILAARS